MLTIQEKEILWQRVSKEFPSDSMLRDLHFGRELIMALKERVECPISYRKLSLMAREEFVEWLKVHPEFAEE